jgi:hypothetical protein
MEKHQKKKPSAQSQSPFSSATKKYGKIVKLSRFCHTAVMYVSQQLRYHFVKEEWFLI